MMPVKRKDGFGVITVVVKRPVIQLHYFDEVGIQQIYNIAHKSMYGIFTCI